MEQIHLQAAQLRCKLYSFARQVEAHEVKENAPSDGNHFSPLQLPLPHGNTPDPLVSKQRAAYVVHNNLLLSENAELKAKLDAALQLRAQRDACILQLKEELRGLHRHVEKRVKACDEKTREQGLFGQYLSSVKEESLALKDTVRKLNGAFAANRDELVRTAAECSELAGVLQEHVAEIRGLRTAGEANRANERELLAELARENAARQQAVADKAVWELHATESRGRMVRLQECATLLGHQLRTEQEDGKRAFLLSREAEVRARLAAEGLQKSCRAQEEMVDRHEALLQAAVQQRPQQQQSQSQQLRSEAPPPPLSPRGDASPTPVFEALPEQTPSGFVPASLLHNLYLEKDTTAQTPVPAPAATPAPVSSVQTPAQNPVESAHARMVRTLQILERDNCTTEAVVACDVPSADRASSPRKRYHPCDSDNSLANNISVVTAAGTTAENTAHTAGEVCSVCREAAYGLMVICSGCRRVEVHSACARTLVPGYRVGARFMCPSCSDSAPGPTTSSH